MLRPDGAFHTRSPQRHTLSLPTGTFNFVRVQGDTPRARPLLISVNLAHAQIAAGHPVVYAGTARFERGQMAWWSNYSGTYQPIAAFRTQAGLPEDKFVPWQKLQMGGLAMQRGTFLERRAVEPAQPSPSDGSAALPSRTAGAKTSAATGSSAGGVAGAGAKIAAASPGTAMAHQKIASRDWLSAGACRVRCDAAVHARRALGSRLAER